MRPGPQLKAAFSPDAGAQEIIFIVGPLLTVVSDHAAPRGARSPILLPAVARVATFTFGIGFPVGALTIVATASESARADARLAGWILAVNAVGALIGATVVGIRPLGSVPERLLTLCGVFLAVGYLPLAITELPAWAYIVTAAISGLMLPPLVTGVIVGASGTSAITFIGLSASTRTAVLSLIALPQRRVLAP